MPQREQKINENMKTYFTYTAIIEALTGLGLIFTPAIVARILLGEELKGSLEVVLAMVAGAAICTIALLSWLCRSNIVARAGLIVLLFYNITISVVLLVASDRFGYNGIPLYGVIGFHLFQSVYSVILLKKQKLGTK
jgi:hypothetical protein